MFSSTLRGVSIDRREITLLQIWIVPQNFTFGHPGRQHVEYIPHGQAKSTDTRLPRALPWYAGHARKINLIDHGHERIIAHFSSKSFSTGPLMARCNMSLNT